MYYEITKTSTLGKKIIELHEHIKNVHTKCQEWVMKNNNGHSPLYTSSPNYIVGGVDAITFEKVPKGWTQLNYHFPDYYYPEKRLKANEKIIKEMEKLPSVTKKDFVELFGLQQKTYGSKYFRCVGMKSTSEAFLVTVPVFVDDWTPPADMKRIRASRYLELMQVKQLQE